MRCQQYTSRTTVVSFKWHRNETNWNVEYYPPVERKHILRRHYILVATIWTFSHKYTVYDAKCSRDYFSCSCVFVMSSKQLVLYLNEGHTIKKALSRVDINLLSWVVLKIAVSFYINHFVPFRYLLTEKIVHK